MSNKLNNKAQELKKVSKTLQEIAHLLWSQAFHIG